VDIRMDRSGRPNIMELNPLAGLHPTHSDLPILAELVGMPYTELIGWILKSALERSEAVVGTVAERPRILTRRRARAGVSAAG
jgi:D-alanine-D-alanine ligase